MLIPLHFSPDYFSSNWNAKVLLLFKFSPVTLHKTVLRQGLHEQIIFFVSPYQMVKKKKTYAILVELEYTNFIL